MQVYLWLLLDVEELDKVRVLFQIFLFAPPSSGNGAKSNGWITTCGMAGGAEMTMSSISSVHFSEDVSIGASISIFKRNHSILDLV